MAKLIKTLVIDDDPVSRKMLAKALEKGRHITIQSANGKHAWETLWENHDIGLVVTDMMMPDMDGRELIQIIRGNQAFYDLPIVIVSGVVASDQVEDVLRLGNCVFCNKPINLDEIRSKIEVLLNRD